MTFLLQAISPDLSLKASTGFSKPPQRWVDEQHLTTGKMNRDDGTVIHIFSPLINSLSHTVSKDPSFGKWPHIPIRQFPVRHFQSLHSDNNQKAAFFNRWSARLGWFEEQCDCLAAQGEKNGTVSVGQTNVKISFHRVETLSIKCFGWNYFIVLKQ